MARASSWLDAMKAIAAQAGLKVIMDPEFGVVAILPVERWINCQTPEGLLQSQILLLSGETPGLMINGNQAEKGICIGHGASIHPTARLFAPLYIGPNCRIGARVVAGGGTLITPRTSRSGRFVRRS